MKDRFLRLSTFDVFAQYICLGDVNNDNWMDIVTANLLDDSVGVLLGLGNGTFDSMITYSTGDGSNPRWLALGHMNGDDRLDIVCANWGTGNIAILFGDADGTFTTIITQPIGNGSHPTAVALGDIDNDQRLDIVIVDGNGNVFVFIDCNNGDCILLEEFKTGASIFSIVLADFNSDSNLDIAVTNTFDHNVGVLLGYGNGTFATQKTYLIGSSAQPYNVIAADFNNDQISDLAVTVANTDEVVIFYGHGDGSFTLAKRYSTGLDSKPWSITVAYFDHKEQPEIVVTLEGTTELAVLTDYTAAKFAKQVVYPTGSIPQPYSVAAADFTHDNRSDVVVANSGTNDLGVLVGSDNGTFEKEMVYKIGPNSHPEYVITCDIDQDQQLDIVSVSSKLNSITVMMGQSNGTFANERTYFIGSNSHPSAVVSGDLDNDNWLDLVTANEGTDSVSVLFGFNYPTFQNPVNYSSDDSLGPLGIVVSDFNNDGFPDIATAFYGSRKIGIYLGCGNGSLVLRTAYSLGNNAVPWAITASDLNNDEQVDIVVSDVRTNSIGILLGYGNGSFATARRYPSGGSSPIAVAVGDWNGDNQLDVVVANDQSGNVTVLYGYGDGTFSTVQLLYTTEDFPPDSIVLCDLDNDGVLDLVLPTTLLGDAKIASHYGSRAAGNQVTSRTTASSQPRGVAVADFNDDIRTDIAIAVPSISILVIFLNNGNRTFSYLVVSLAVFSFAPSSLDVGDFSNDNILDIVIVSSQTNDIMVLPGDSDGKFLWGKIYSTGIGSASIALAMGDFNNDTRLDIAVTNYYTNNMVVFLGGGSEPFASVKKYETGYGSQPHSVAIGDVNNDRHMDIVVANYGTDNVGVLMGNSDREFTSMMTYPTGTASRPYCVAVADLNNDNSLDIVVTTSETDNIVVLPR